jgi:Outer membrane receptor proteins, mostly Fe transport
MKKFIAGLVLMFGFINSYSQNNSNGSGTLSGTIIDSLTHAPLEYATISIIPEGKKDPVNGTTSSSNGEFKIENIPLGTYSVLIESVGYKPSRISNLDLNREKAVIHLATISLLKSVQTLQTIVVTAQGKTIENKIDRIVFNAEKDLTSQTGVATDVLKKVPQVSVDVDGNVELSGSSSIRFLINGKPSSAFGSSIADVLQAIPASQIKSIEVITNPGAKYDAQGLGGIINIILKKNTAKGINGNVSLTAGTRQNNGSFNFNARHGKFGVNAFISGNYRPNSTIPFTYDRLSKDSVQSLTQLHQEGSSQFNRDGLQYGGGFDWSIDEKNSLTGSISFNRFENNGHGYFQQTQTTTNNGSVFSNSVTDNYVTGNFHFHNNDVSLNYKRSFNKEDQELNISANRSVGTNHSSASNNDYQLPGNYLYYGTNSLNPGTQKETEILADYTQPLRKNVLLGIGSKFNFRDITSFSNVLQYDPGTQSFKQNNYLTNSLNYHQKVYAFYSELTLPLGTIADAKIGARYERTEIDAFYSNLKDQASFPGYNTLVPSVFLSRKINDNKTIKLSYSKRIERPDFRDLNPFINTSDLKNFSAGNPLLQPEIGNRFELGFQQDLGKTGSIMANLFYRTSDHDIQPYIVYYPTLKVGDSTYTNVSVSTRENIGLEKDAGLNIFADLHFIDKLNIRTNFFVFHRNTTNELDPGYNASSINFRSNINASYSFNTNLAAEFFGNFNSARHEVQGTYPSFTSYSIAIRQQLWKKKASIAFTTINPFNEYVTQRSELFGPNFTATNIRKIPFRSFGINLTFKFGKLEFKKDKEPNNENLNMSGE